jgi:drug/metabolite transporter (DMT)-like permease
MVAAVSSDTGLGLVAAMGAASLYEVSYTLQALEARTTDARHALRPRLLLLLARRGRWLAAIAMAVAAFALQVLALAHAPITLVQPTLALGLLLLLALGVRVLGERVGATELVAVLCIVVAVAGIAVTAPDRSSALQHGPALAAALSVLGAVAVAPYVVPRARVGAALLLASAGAGDAWAVLAAKAASDEANRGRWIAVLAWSVAAGAAALLGLTSETSALQRLPATRVAPVVLVGQVVVPALLAPLVAGESWSGTPAGGVLLAACLGLVTAGTVLLGRSLAVGGLFAGEALEHDRGGGRQLRE